MGLETPVVWTQPLIRSCLLFLRLPQFLPQLIHFVSFHFLPGWHTQSGPGPQGGLHLLPLHWKYRVLTTGPPGESPTFSLFRKVADHSGRLGSCLVLPPPPPPSLKGRPGLVLRREPQAQLRILGF